MVTPKRIGYYLYNVHDRVSFPVGVSKSIYTTDLSLVIFLFECIDSQLAQLSKATQNLCFLSPERGEGSGCARSPMKSRYFASLNMADKMKTA
jgi:hypothetical protein